MNLEYFYIIKSAEGFIENQGFNFSKNYNFECVIKDNNIEIKRSKKLSSNMFSYGSNIYNISAIVGTNGSGKSSVMRELITSGGHTLYIFSEKKEGKINFYFEIMNVDDYEINMIDSEEKVEIYKLQAEKINFFFYSNDIFSKKTAFAENLKHKKEKDIPTIKIINHSPRAILEYMLPYNTINMINTGRVNEFSSNLSNKIEKIEIIENLLRLNLLINIKKYDFSEFFKNEIYATENLYIKIIIDNEFLTPNIEDYKRKSKDNNDEIKSKDNNDETKSLDEEILNIYNKRNAIRDTIDTYTHTSVEKYKKYIKTKILFSYYIKKIDRYLDDEKANEKANEKTLLDYSNNIDELNKLNFDDMSKYIYECNKNDSSKLKNLDNIIDEINFKIAENKEFYCNLNDNSEYIRDLLNCLAELDIYSVFKFNLLNEDGKIIDESSGEKSFMNVLASMNYVINPLDGLKNINFINLKCLNNIVKKKENKNDSNRESIVFILDEPDTSMHPEWVRKFINFLTMYVNEFFEEIDCQIILTSNNPILLSDLTKDNVIYLENGQVKDKSKSAQTFGQNIHTIMKDNFFMSNTYGDYVINYINSISDYIKSMNNISSSSDHNSEKDIELFNEKFKNYGVHVEKCEDIYTELERLISFIGEDILRNYLKQMLLKITPNNERIKLLEEELKKLRGEND